jgi:Predicted membrane protein
MTVRKIIVLACGVLLLSALAAAAAAAVWKLGARAERLSEEEALSSVLRLYPGEVTRTEWDGAVYRIGLTMETGSYVLEVDGTDGSVVSIARTDEGAATPAPGPETPGADTEPTPGAEPTPAPTEGASKPAAGATDRPAESPGSGTTATPEPSPKPPALLGSAEAKQIALRQVPGTVKDVEAGSRNDYLVEIETGDGKEAVVQVNRISGAVMSVTWDDDDDDDDDDDGDDDDGDLEDDDD